jgi:Tol biopolymer transport system component
VRTGIALIGLVAALGVGAMTHSGVGIGAPAARSPALLTYVASPGGLCAVRADGSHPQRLTPAWRLHSPTWSPRGAYVAFSRATGTGQSKIFVANAGGKIVSRFGSGTNNGGPLWSPDGRHIEYVGAFAHIYGLMVAAPDGSGDGEVAGSPAWPTYGPANPTWSPDGQRLAFTDGDDVAVPQGIFSVEVKGSDRRLLVRRAYYPAYSPDGTKLAFVAFGRTGLGGVFVANADGSEPRAVSVAAGAAMPAWSPDGTRIAFVRDSAIVAARADGSGEDTVAPRVPSRVVVSGPRWSPDGRFVAFTRGPESSRSNRPFKSSIVVARAEGDNTRVIIRRFAKDVVEAPVWRSATPLPAVKRPPCPRH